MVKKSSLLAVLAMLAVCSAAPAHAYVQPHDVIGVPRNPTPQIGDVRHPVRVDEPLEGMLDDPSGPNGEDPTRPVPEPGTMAMASMGLLALGAAIKKKRGR